MTPTNRSQQGEPTMTADVTERVPAPEWRGPHGVWPEDPWNVTVNIGAGETTIMCTGCAVSSECPAEPELGESDVPQSCEVCGAILDVRLTDTGLDYVRVHLSDAWLDRERTPVLDLWAAMTDGVLPAHVIARYTSLTHTSRWWATADRARVWRVQAGWQG